MKKIITIKGNKGNDGIKTFEWKIIEKCHMHCSYCFYTIDNRNDIKTGWVEKEWKRIITEINDNQQKSKLKYKVEFFGGECLLHPDLDKIINLCDVEYILFTNLQWNFKYVEKFIKNNCKKIYTSIHFEHNNNKVLDNIKMLLDKDIKVDCNVMLENIKTEDEILEMYFKLKEMGCNRVSLRIIDFLGKENQEKQKEYYKNMNMNKFEKFMERTSLHYVNGNVKNEIGEFKKSNLEYKTKCVLCDIGKYYTAIDKSKYYFCCVKEGYKNNMYYNNYSVDKMEREIFCYNYICNRYDLRYGTKKGVFI